jgi:hypothetical protein
MTIPATATRIYATETAIRGTVTTILAMCSHFPDFRIEYELESRDRHEDVEVLTNHYRGQHATSRTRAGFTCYRSSGRSGGRAFDPRVAEHFL